MNWKNRLGAFASEMKSCVAEARKERETWLETLAFSNSNPSDGQAAADGESRGNYEARSEIISDNTKLLKQKIEKNATIDPAEDSI